MAHSKQGVDVMYFFFFFDGISNGGCSSATNPSSSHDNLFEKIKHINNNGIEFWYARELQSILGYKEWRNFSKVIDKAKVACKGSNHAVDSEFVDINKLVDIGANLQREIQDIVLSRYACYLIAMNGDSRKKIIALAQTYFAIQTRTQELQDLYQKDLKRIEARKQLKESEKRLSQNIYERGVDNDGFGRIRSKGDRALFGGHSTQDMKTKLGVKKNRSLADFLPAVTIAAKNLATEMTNYNVEQNDLYGEPPITTEHVQNNTIIRDMLNERGIRPEELPPAIDIKKIERKIKSKKILPKSPEIY